MSAATVRALDAAKGAIRELARLQSTAGLDGEDLVAWGSALREIVVTLTTASQVLQEQVTHYGDERLLSDDLGADPYERIGEMRRHLAALTMALTNAAVQAQAYHSAASHISVEVDPDAPRG